MIKINHVNTIRECYDSMRYSRILHTAVPWLGYQTDKISNSHKVPHPDSKLHGANMRPTWVLLAPDGPHVGPMKIAIRACITLTGQGQQWCAVVIILKNIITAPHCAHATRVALRKFVSLKMKFCDFCHSTKYKQSTMILCYVRPSLYPWHSSNSKNAELMAVLPSNYGVPQSLKIMDFGWQQ